VYKVVDLFAGAGGLSLGFMQTRKYDIKVAFENSPYMQETYRLNHPGVEVQGDVCAANYDEIKEKYGDIDVVIGGPPCQGFSNANRQKNHAISQNNMLVKQYIRAILELNPKAFVMENVSMLKSDVHRFYMEESDVETVKKYKIPVKSTQLHLLDQAYIFDGALEIVKNQQKIQQYLWPEQHYFELNVIYKAAKNPEKMKSALEKHKKKLCAAAADYVKLHDDNNHIASVSAEAFQAISEYYSGELDASVLKSRIEPAILIQRMLSKAQEIHENHIVVDAYSVEDGIAAVIRSFAVYDYLESVLQAPENDYVLDKDVLCAADYGAPQKRMRFVVIGIKRRISSKIALPKGRFDADEYRTVRDAISDLEDVKPVVELEDDKDGIVLQPKENLGELASSLRDSKILKNHIYCAHLLMQEHQELVIENLLNVFFVKQDLIQLIGKNCSISDETALSILRIASLSPDTMGYYANGNARSAPFIQISEHQYLRTIKGLLDEPFDFILYNIRNFFPEAWDKNVNQREAVFRTQLYTVFDDPRFSCVQHPVIIKEKNKTLTDIDAVVIDKKTGEIALFQLKWQDPADYSPFTLKSKRSNYYSVAEKWLEIIEKWLSNSADEDIASKLGVKVKYFDKKKISIFVLGRRRGNYSGNGPYPYECAWSQWYQIMYAASYLRQENEFTISNLYKLIVSTSPFNIKISEKPVTFCYGKYRIKFGGKTFCGKDTR